MAKSLNSGFRAKTVHKHKDGQDKTLLKLSKTESEVINERNGVMNQHIGYESVLISGDRFISGSTRESKVQCGRCAEGRPEGWFHPAEPKRSGVALESDCVRCPQCHRWCCPVHTRSNSAGDILPCFACHEDWDLARVVRLVASALKVVFFREVER